MTFYVKATTADGSERRSKDLPTEAAARAAARILRLDVEALARVDVCQGGTGRIVAAWDRDGEKWLRTI